MMKYMRRLNFLGLMMLVAVMVGASVVFVGCGRSSSYVLGITDDDFELTITLSADEIYFGEWLTATVMLKNISGRSFEIASWSNFMSMHIYGWPEIDDISLPRPPDISNFKNGEIRQKESSFGGIYYLKQGVHELTADAVFLLNYGTRHEQGFRITVSTTFTILEK